MAIRVPGTNTYLAEGVWTHNDASSGSGPGFTDVLSSSGESDVTGTGASAPTTAGAAVPGLSRRFYGVVEVDATRLGRDAGRIAQEVLAHLTGLKNAEVTVSLEIQAEVPDGIDQAIIRAVTENCRVLKFKTLGFEES